MSTRTTLAINVVRNVFTGKPGCAVTERMLQTNLFENGTIPECSKYGGPDGIEKKIYFLDDELKDYLEYFSSQLYNTEHWDLEFEEVYGFKDDT